MTSPRRTRLLAALTLGGTLLGPAAMEAQDSAATAGAPAEPVVDVQAAPPGRTHTVKKGDTLWDLARAYLNDPFLWPDIYRINTTVVEDPHWIYPGEVLQIPPGGPVAEPVVSNETSEPAESEPAGPPGATLFAQRRIHPSIAASRRDGVEGLEPHAAVRQGEYVAAPFLDREGGPRRAGIIFRTSDIAGIGVPTNRNRFQIDDEVYVRLPDGASPRPGDRYVAFRLGPRVDGAGQVVIPTGVITVRRGASGEATTARITRVFDQVMARQGLMPYDSLSMSPTDRPSAVAGGPTARVVWMKNDPVLPSLQRYLVLDATAKAGLRPGDQFTLVRPRVRTEDATLPELELGVAQVVRVTPYGASALIIGQSQPAIKVGTVARVSAKMP